MALQVWLPLNNGNLNNQGLSNIDFTNYTGGSFVLDNYGKIGKCYKNCIVKHLSEEILGNTWTIALWVINTTSWSTQGNNILLCKNIDSANPCQFYLSVYGGNVFRVAINSGSGGMTVSHEYTFSTNTWYHLCVTYSGSEICQYINGALVNTVQHTSTQPTGHLNLGIGCRSNNSNGTEPTGYSSGVKFNDVRIYDHCLSPKEVSDIAKGLVLHYKLDNPEILKSKYSTITWNQLHNVNVSTYPMMSMTVYVDNGVRLYCSGTPNVSSTARLIALPDVPVGHKVYLKVFGNYSGGCVLKWRPYSTSMTTLGNTFNYSMICTETDDTYNTVNNRAVFITTTINEQISFDITTNVCDLTQMFGSGNEPTTEEFEMMFPLPYYPYNAGTQMTLDYKTIYDCSGYGNDGTINGTLSVSDNSPRYGHSIEKVSTSYIETTSPSTEVRSVSFWCKWKTSVPSTSIVFCDNKSRLAFGLYTSGIICSTQPLYTKQFEIPTLSADTWYHIAVINTGDSNTSTERELYINGIKQTQLSSNNYWNFTNDVLDVGSRSNNTSNGINGYISDFRMYSTTLSEQDIKDLYNTSAYVDNGSNLECFELLEADSYDSPEITKRGQVLTDNLVEKIEYLYLPAGTCVNTGLEYTTSDTCKAITTIRYASGGSGRDLMGFSSSSRGYWGVTADGTWENHGSSMSHTDSDITKISTVVFIYNNTSEYGPYKVGALGRTSDGYSVRDKYIYSVKLYKNNILERNLVPAKIGTQCGLIDILTGNFYPCNNTNGTISTENSQVKLFEDYIETNQIIEI